MKINKNILYYDYRFCHLSTAKYGDKVAPHKPLLLLSLIDLIEKGVITSPQVELSEDLVVTFQRNANLYTKGIEHFHPNIGMPFFYMRNEPFWQLVPKVDGISPTANTITSLRRHYICANIDDELFLLLQNPKNRDTLRSTLKEKYFQL